MQSLSNSHEKITLTLAQSLTTWYITFTGVTEPFLLQGCSVHCVNGRLSDNKTFRWQTFGRQTYSATDVWPTGLRRWEPGFGRLGDMKSMLLCVQRAHKLNKLITLHAQNHGCCTFYDCNFSIRLFQPVNRRFYNSKQATVRDEIGQALFMRLISLFASQMRQRHFVTCRVVILLTRRIYQLACYRSKVTVNDWTWWASKYWIGELHVAQTVNVWRVIQMLAEQTHNLTQVHHHHHHHHHLFCSNNIRKSAVIKAIEPDSKAYNSTHSCLVNPCIKFVRTVPGSILILFNNKKCSKINFMQWTSKVIHSNSVMLAGRLLHSVDYMTSKKMFSNISMTKWFTYNLYR